MDILLGLCASAHISPYKVCEKIGLNRSAVAKWKKGALPSGTTLNALAQFFNVSVDYLLDNQQKEKPALTKKDERDISKKMEETLSQLEKQQAGLMFDGEPLDDETKELLAISLKNSLELAKKIAKQKYTPKKYRKKSE
jgi:transcriptional regulator with XRE-family HTH domain